MVGKRRSGMVMNLASIRSVPHARYHVAENLVTWHPQGILDDAMADWMVEFIEMQEREIETPFNRYVDYNGLIEIRFTVAHTFHIAQRRRARYEGPPVRGAFFASWIMAAGFARLYADYMRGGMIDIRVFDRREEAAKWLGVPISLLT